MSYVKKHQHASTDDLIKTQSTFDPDFMHFIQKSIKDSLEVLLPGLFRDALQQVTSDLADLRAEGIKTKAVIEELREQINNLNGKVKYMDAKHDDLEQEARSSSIIMMNEWIEQPTESTMSLAKGYIQEALHIDVHDNDIIKCFRIGRKNRLDREKKPRPILVKFSSVSLKTEVLLARRRIRKFTSDRYPTPIFINEDLTPTRHDMYTKCRELKKANKIKDCWTQNGRIFLKTCDDQVKPAMLNEVLDMMK